MPEVETEHARRRPPPQGPSVGLMLAGMASILALVCLVLWLGESNAPPPNEDAMLSGAVTLLPRSETWLGVDVSLSEDALRPDHPIANGVIISRVMVGSPADTAGLQAGDVIVRVDGKSVQKPVQLGTILSARKPGDTIGFIVNRNGQERKFHVTLSVRSLGALAAATVNNAVTASWLGVDVQEVDPLMVDRHGLPDQRGVVIAYIHPSSPAVAAGLAQGDVIRRIGETRLRDTHQLASLIGARRPGDTLRMVVWHAGQQNEVQITLAQTPPPGQEPMPTLPEAEVEIEAGWLGLDIVPLSRAEAEELGLPEGLRGMVVDDVAAGVGVDAGFLAGDVITAINGKPTATVGQFKDASENNVGALVDVVRSGRHIYIAVPPPGSVRAGNVKPKIQQVFFQPR